ncbi:MAG TPA: rod shape-determining protein RodA [Paracoccaceae bacterium]|nr:rod shape-determining protein RodA [Paracoccaceae bacterium]
MMGLSANQSARLGLLQKILRLNFSLILLALAIAVIGFLMLYSVAGGTLDPWASRQIPRFAAGLGVMFVIAMVDIRVWRRLAPAAYGLSLVLLIAVEFFGESGMGATRWLDIGPIQLQPSELMKISLVMMLAHYYASLDRDRVSHPLWLLPPLLMILVPVALVVKQPDLGTAVLLGVGSFGVLFLAGVSLWYFGTGLLLGAAAAWAIMASKGTEYQILARYQYDRIATFITPESDPLGAGYHITQSKIAMGSGGLSGRGFMQGTQSRLNFLPEKHTDFIFTTLAEEFGLVGSLSLLALYVLVLFFCFAAMAANRDRFGALLIGGLSMTFFLYWSVNMAMVTGLIPVVGVPLPLVSYGGSAMLVLMVAFGLIQSAHIHRPRSAEEI